MMLHKITLIHAWPSVKIEWRRDKIEVVPQNCLEASHEHLSSIRRATTLVFL